MKSLESITGRIGAGWKTTGKDYMNARLARQKSEEILFDEMERALINDRIGDFQKKCRRSIRD